MCETYMECSYIYIYIYIYTEESRNTKNTYDFFVQVQNFLLPLSLKVLRHKERDTHSFYSGFSICTPISCDTCPRLRRSSESRPFLFCVQFSTLLTDFFKIPIILPACASGAWRHSHPQVNLLSDFYFDICEQHILPARASTPVLKFAPN